MNKFYITRHGQTLNNVLGIVQGQSDSDLTDAGISSLIERAEKLKEPVFDEVYCSPLARAKKSLSVITPYLSYTSEIKYLDSLKEIDFGDYTGKSQQQIIEIIRYHKTNTSIPYPNGESGEQLIQRVCQFVDAFNHKHQNKTCLIVTHFGVLETIATCYAGGEFEDIKQHKDDIARITFYTDKKARLEWL